MIPSVPTPYCRINERRKEEGGGGFTESRTQSHFFLFDIFDASPKDVVSGRAKATSNIAANNYLSFQRRSAVSPVIVSSKTDKTESEQRVDGEWTESPPLCPHYLNMQR